MTTAPQGKFDKYMMGGCALLSFLYIWVDRRWPGSSARMVVWYPWQVLFLIWFGSKIRAGYLRRRPYWTRDSWRRYLRLTAMPVTAVVLFLGLVYLSDLYPGLLGPAHSVARGVSAAALVILMLVAVAGIMRGLDWLTDGEPSEQFMRTRWFQRPTRFSRP